MVAMTVSSQARSDSPARSIFNCIERDRGKDDEQDHREGAGVAEVALREALLVDVVLDHPGGVDRTALAWSPRPCRRPGTSRSP